MGAQTYIGTKGLVQAVEMSHDQYFYDVCNVNSDSFPNPMGFCRLPLVRDSQWISKDDFELMYSPINAMSYSRALEALKLGYRVARAGWNGKGQWIKLVTNYAAADTYQQYTTDDYQITPVGWIGIKTAGNVFGPYVASNCDQLANDWFILDEPEPASRSAL